MEAVRIGQDFNVLVDFAHTPNSLEKALTTARKLAPGRLLVVFGCAGLRDRAKRPLMGELAGRYADSTIITAEDPRTEDLQAIMDQIAAGCAKSGAVEGLDYWLIPDRAEAITFALNSARRGDTVLVAGKGHERSMCFGETEVPWSDQETVREALRRLLAR
jgi:UDP-N-acetylmuramoyl-L-alanyl-D-glutamate--2,6-diaminopimelate ligase